MSASKSGPIRFLQHYPSKRLNAKLPRNYILLQLTLDMYTFTISSESIGYGYAVFQSKGDLKQLNFEVTGSEGEHVFSVRINKGLLKQHKYRRNKESDEEWEGVVRYVLTGDAQGVDTNSVVTQCSHDDVDKTLTLSIRRRKSDGIVARLGDIELRETATGDPDLMTWVRSIDESRSDVEKTLRESRTQTEMFRDRCLELEKQMQSLIAEKKRYERDLVIKFSALLDTKKRKMRQFEGHFGDGFGDYVKKEETLEDLADTGEKAPTTAAESIQIDDDNNVEMSPVLVKEETLSQALSPEPEPDSDATVESE